MKQDKELTFKETVSKYFSLATKKKMVYMFVLIFVILGAVASRAVPYFTGEVIDYLGVNAFSSALTLVGFLFIAQVLVSVFQSVRDELVDVIMIEDLWKGSKLEYINSLQHIDYEYHTNKSSGSLISLAKRADGALITAFFEVNVRSVQILFEFLISVTILFFIDYRLALILGVSLVLSIAIALFIVKWNIALRTRFNEEDDRITGLIVDNMIGFETVKIFANEDWERERFLQTYRPWTQSLWRFAHSFRLLDLVLGVISALGILAVFTYGVHLIQMDVISLGAFVAALVYIFDISRKSSDLVYKLRDLAKVYVDLNRYFEIINLKPKIKDKKGAITLEDVKGEIEFKDVKFSYHLGEDVLKDISLKIAAKEKVALVGKSGGGKTTLTKLLMRFYDIDSGQILFDGVDIKDIKLKSLRKLIGLVPQDPVLFNDTISYNIAYGAPTASKKQVQNAAEKANLHEFIISLPQGYETIVGERGIKLSGGQKQRLAIARVILEDPEIIIFDEATSQLDSENEKKISEAFTNMSSGKTTIVIAHRLSTIMNSDKILVFENGNIVEKGTHTELTERENGVYKSLWSLQTSAARDFAQSNANSESFE